MSHPSSFPFFGWISLITLLILLCPPLASAQQDATLRVVVTSDEDGRVVPGANLILASPVGDTLQAGATDHQGYHEFAAVSPGEYILEVSYIGHETYRETVNLEAGRHVRRVELAVSAEELDEVLIEAERRIALRQAGLQTADATDLERIPTPGPGGDLATYLQSIPGVVTGGDRGGEFHVRGGTPSQNLVLVDNIPILKPFHISNLFSAFPEATIQNVEMYAGGFGAEYLGATSSIIDVGLRPGNMREVQASAALSPYLVSVHAEGPIETDEQSFLGMVRHSLIEELANPLTGESTPMRFYDMAGRYSVYGERFICNVTAIHSQDNGQIDPYRDISLSWSNTGVGGRCFGFDERLAHPYDLSLGYTNFHNTEGTTDNVERSASVHMVYFRFDHEQTIFGAPIDYGMQWMLTHYSAELDERFTSYDSFTEAPFVGQLFASTDFTPSNHLTITPSVGSQLAFRGTIRPTLEPRLRLSFRPAGHDRQELSLALGKYNQVAEQITDERDAGTVFSVWKPSSANEPLPSALHGIVGYRQAIGESLEVSTEGYAKALRNIPVSAWTPEARLATETALAHGTAYGLDTRLELDAGSFYALLGYAWSKITYEAASDDLGAWIGDRVFSYSPAHDQRHQLNVVMSYDIGGFSTNVRWEFGSGQPYTQVYGYDLALDIPTEHPEAHPGTAMTLYSRPYGARLPTYHRFDVSVDRSFQVTPELAIEAEAGAINLYNRRNIFYFDASTLQRVDQMPILPYLALNVTIN